WAPRPALPAAPGRGRRAPRERGALRDPRRVRALPDLGTAGARPPAAARDGLRAVGGGVANGPRTAGETWNFPSRAGIMNATARREEVAMGTRDELHRFIDGLPEGLVAEVLDFAQFVARKAGVATVTAALDALPEDDEPLTEREI